MQPRPLTLSGSPVRGQDQAKQGCPDECPIQRRWIEIANLLTLRPPPFWLRDNNNNKKTWVKGGKIQADSCDPKTGANIHHEDRAWNLPWEEEVVGWEQGAGGWGGGACHGLLPPAEGGAHLTKGRVQAVQTLVLVYFSIKGIKHQQLEI